MKKLLPVFLLSLCALAYSQETEISYNGSGNYTLVERTDLRRYDNGKYTGLVSREVRSFICRTSSPLVKNEDDRFYDGNFFVEEKTRHDNMTVKKGLRVSIPSQFIIEKNGEMIMVQDNGYPAFRSFPAYPSEKIKPGDKWSANAIRTADPLNKGVFTKIPMLVEYTYLKDDVFQKQDVYVLSARWATRYGISYFDYEGDPELTKATGSHNATMYISRKTGNALVVRDQVDETFFYSDGKQVSFKGSIALFTEYPPSSDTKPLIAALKKSGLVEDTAIFERRPVQGKAAGSGSTGASGVNGPTSGTSASGSGATGTASSGILPGSGGQSGTSNGSSGGGSGGNGTGSGAVKEKQPAAALPSVSAAESKNISVRQTDAGIMLELQNLQFKSNTAELLPGEEKRLDEIAAILKTVKDNMFLVEGHTADTGYPSGEKKLSEERALVIAEALVRRGISADRFICKGSGALKPVADNSTPEGMAANRRVEITILEAGE